MLNKLNLKSALFGFVFLLSLIASPIFAADTKISDYPEATTLSDSDLFVTAQEDVGNKKITSANLKLQILPYFTFFRPKFTWVDINTITIGPGGYYLYGKGWCYWTTDITYDLGSGGSNANSDALTASAFQYIAIDYSSVSAAGVLVAANFINRLVASAPAYSGAKGGCYQDTDDRTIFGVLTNASSQVLEFFHNGNLMDYADKIENQAAVDIDTAFTDIGALKIPTFATVGLISALGGVAGKAPWYWRTNGQAGATGHYLLYDTVAVVVARVITDPAQVIELKASTSNTGTIQVFTDGWEFPRGM